MELDRKERLVLHNQYLILDKLYPNQSYDRNAEIVSDGYAAEYDHLILHIFEPGLSVQDCKFVRDVMYMFMRLKWAYEDLPEGEKADVPKHGITFSGFDGNNETELMGYARFLVEDGHSFQNIRNDSDGMNSHMPTVSRYRNMLDIWKFGGMDTKEKLTKADVLALANAKH